MRVCFVIGSMNYSGAEKVLSMIVDEIKHLHDVHLILLEKEQGTSSKEDGVTIYGAKTRGSRVHRILERWSSIRAVADTVRPDVVVSFGYVCNVNTLMALLGHRVPLVVCERNDPFYDPRKRMQKASRWLLYRFANGYVFQTEAIRKFFSPQIQSRSCVIPNPIEAPREKWDRAAAENKFVTVARLDDFQKDQTTMIRAFSDFVKMHPEYSLEIYGDGPSKDYYSGLIEKLNLGHCVHLMGKTENASEAIMSSRAFLLTSVFEGMPNALIEAMAAGVPCISTDCGGGGASALYEYCQGVLLVPVGDKDSLVRAMERIVGDESKAQSLSDNGLKVIDILDKKKVASQWLDYLCKVALEQ